MGVGARQRLTATVGGRPVSRSSDLLEQRRQLSSKPATPRANTFPTARIAQETVLISRESYKDCASTHNIANRGAGPDAEGFHG